jgi:hypothetical protein
MTNPLVKKIRGTIQSFLGSFSRLLSRIGGWRAVAPYLAVIAVAAVLIGLGAAGKLPFTAAAVPAVPTAAVSLAPPATSYMCATELIRGDVDKVHAVMLEFYDASALASTTQADQLVDVIPSLQEIRRRADALKVSPCLKVLRSFQVSHMNIVINTLLAFMSQSDQSVLIEGIIQARLLNEEYKKEKARLLGETYVPPPTATPAPAATGTIGTS